MVWNQALTIGAAVALAGSAEAGFIGAGKCAEGGSVVRFARPNSKDVHEVIAAADLCPCGAGNRNPA